MKLTIGPGALVAAAFIGPGTVTACTVAGATSGYTLLWALVFATVATIILQDMVARLGVMGRLGLGEALMRGAGHPALKVLIAILILTALALGNAAYEAGNLSGGALGLQAIGGEGNINFRLAVTVIAFIAATALFFGKYRTFERALIGLVIVMSLAFIAAVVLVRPDFGALVAGLKPTIPDGKLLTVVAIIGTTIVPYNLFLHAAAARERWTEASPEALKAARSDTLLSIGLGGLISMFILVTAAASLFGTGQDVTSAVDMAKALTPVYGSGAQYLIGIGLFAAGLTSAITAPLATGYVVAEILGTKDEVKRQRLTRYVALVVVAIGLAVSLIGLKPVQIILTAQFANGLLLPIIGVFLLITMNRSSIMGTHTNGIASNILGAGVLLITCIIGGRLVLKAAGII